MLAYHKITLPLLYFALLLLILFLNFKGPSLSSALVNAGITTFAKIEQTNPRELEMVTLFFHTELQKWNNI